LSFSVVDAAYSAALDAVVVASTQPDAVQIIDSDLQQRAIPLAGPPMAIRTTPGGRDALVGHQTFVSHVDLVNGRVLAVHQVPAAALQFVVPGNDVAYLFPFDHRLDFVVALHLPSGTLARGPDKHYRLAVRYAPALGAIYGATLGVSPANLVRYGLDGMAISPGTRSSSGRGHPIGDNLWLDAPGQRIVTERGSVFRALPGHTPDDMTYLGDIALEPIDRFPRIQHFHHSAEFRKVLVIQKNSKWEDDHVTDTRLRVYEGEFFQLTELRAMPCLQAGATRFPLHGRFAIPFRSVRGALVLSQLKGPAAAQDWTMALTPL
jgi:hypothetical protein